MTAGDLVSFGVPWCSAVALPDGGRSGRCAV